MQVFSCEYYETFKNSFFYRPSPVTASVYSKHISNEDAIKTDIRKKPNNTSFLRIVKVSMQLWSRH